MPPADLCTPRGFVGNGLRICLLALAAFATSGHCTPAQPPDWQIAGNPDLQAYFETEVEALESANDLTRFKSLDEWSAARTGYRQQLIDMLGLVPLPERTPLDPVVTGIVENDEFRVEKVQFQSQPGLYVTGNLYLPRTAPGPLPAVLYVCGHGPSKKGDVSFGNKVTYQHHGAWFARNGYVCLTIDSLQLGEIEGIHHGTHRYNRWWWNARGYTPAGVEAWNCIRALDYLETRSEVDPARMGVTGRSGGGAYSWWIAALDDRIQCAVPVAGITTLRNHVVDGCVEGHCDCMFFVNTWRWDYPLLAALVAPRPLLISNTDKDTIFPLEGVVEVHRQVRHIYQLYGKSDQLGLNITEGPHKDTQELRTHAFVWLNRFLRNDTTQFTTIATPFFEPEQLRVFQELPADQRNTVIDEQFVPAAVQPSPEELTARMAAPTEWMSDLRGQIQTRCFAAWPSMDSLSHVRDSVTTSPGKPILLQDSEFARTVVRFSSQPHVPLAFELLHAPTTAPNEITDVTIFQLDQESWNLCQSLLNPEHANSETSRTHELIDTASEEIRRINESPTSAVAFFSPRGQGRHRWVGDEAKQIQILRRFQLIGTTADSMRVWDHLAMLQALRTVTGEQTKLTMYSTGQSPDIALCTVIFNPGLPLQRLDLQFTPDADPNQRTILNISRTVSPAELLMLTPRPRQREGSAQPGECPEKQQ